MDIQVVAFTGHSLRIWQALLILLWPTPHRLVV